MYNLMPICQRLGVVVQCVDITPNEPVQFGKQLARVFLLLLFTFLHVLFKNLQLKGIKWFPGQNNKCKFKRQSLSCKLFLVFRNTSVQQRFPNFFPVELFSKFYCATTTTLDPLVLHSFHISTWTTLGNTGVD